MPPFEHQCLNQPSWALFHNICILWNVHHIVLLWFSHPFKLGCKSYIWRSNSAMKVTAEDQILLALHLHYYMLLSTMKLDDQGYPWMLQLILKSDMKVRADRDIPLLILAKQRLSFRLASSLLHAIINNEIRWSRLSMNVTADSTIWRESSGWQRHSFVEVTTEGQILPWKLQLKIKFF